MALYCICGKCSKVEYIQEQFIDEFPKCICGERMQALDEYMAPIIRILNTKGYETMCCCHGHLTFIDDFQAMGLESPYITFKDIPVLYGNTFFELIHEGNKYPLDVLFRLANENTVGVVNLNAWLRLNLQWRMHNEIHISSMECMAKSKHHVFYVDYLGNIDPELKCEIEEDLMTIRNSIYNSIRYSLGTRPEDLEYVTYNNEDTDNPDFHVTMIAPKYDEEGERER